MQNKRTVFVRHYWRRPPNSPLFAKKTQHVSQHTRKPPHRR